MIRPIDFDQPGDLVTGLYDAFVAGNGDDPGPRTVPALVLLPRQGLGSALFEHALERLRAHGRELHLTETPATGAGARFAASAR